MLNVGVHSQEKHLLLKPTVRTRLNVLNQLSVQFWNQPLSEDIKTMLLLFPVCFKA